MKPLTLLDGPLGAALQAQGVDLSAPAWSANALRSHPDAVAALHRLYADAGAQVHRANTFRTTRRACGADWETLARLAVKLARDAAKPGQRIAGCLGPLEDCYRPDLAPEYPRPEHASLARVLASEEVDLILCETFPNPEEARMAVSAAVETGKPTWVSFTAGPDGKLLTPAQVFASARECLSLGASAVLVNCIAAELTGPYLDALWPIGVPYGAYANAAVWNGAPISAQRYGELAGQWRQKGASIIGGCCGTDASYLAAIHAAA